MNRRPLTLGALALVAVACAALLIVLARGVAAVDAEVAALQSPERRALLADDPEAPSFGPADRVARVILSVDDDIQFRRALGLIEESRRLDHLPNEVLKIHAEAIALLQRVDRGQPQRASRAWGMA